jgi:hypothetical protein
MKCLRMRRHCPHQIEAASMSSQTSDDGSGGHQKRRGESRESRLLKLALLANAFFLLGSIFQVVYAQSGFSRTKSAQGYPVSVLQADDDSTWQTYMSTTAYQGRRLHRAGITSRRVSFIPLSEFDSFDWIYLPIDVREALNSLWHDETTWDGNPQSQLVGWKWSELDDYERDAAAYLGYDEEIWDSFEGPIEQNYKYNADDAMFKVFWNATTAPSEEGTDAPMSYYEIFEQTNSSFNASYPFKPSAWESRSWDSLPVRIIEALEILGCTEELWVSKKQAFTEELSWNDLTEQQQEEASFLGYTEDNWHEILSTYDNAVVNDGASDLEEDNDDEETVAERNAPSEAPVVASVSKDTPKQSANATVKPTGRGDNSKAETGSPTQTTSATPTASPTTPRKAPKMATEPPANVTKLETRFPSKSECLSDDVFMTVLDVEVSWAQMYYLVAALCFLVTGILNWIREQQVFHIWLVQGAICMILSALCTGWTEAGAVLFRALAFHCYLVEGAFMLRLRKNIRPLEGLETLSYALWAGDGLFGSASVVSIITAYWQIIDPNAAFDLNVARGDLLSAWLWLLASVIYMLSPFILFWKVRGGKAHS